MIVVKILLAVACFLVGVILWSYIREPLQPTSVALKRIETNKYPFNNVLHVYVTFSVHGRRDYTVAQDLCAAAVVQALPDLVEHGLSFTCKGWTDDSHKEMLCHVTLLVSDRVIHS